MTDSRTNPTSAEAAPEEAPAAPAAPAAPFMSVLKGNPTPEQTATLALLFAGMANASGAKDDSGPRNDWGRHEERFRRPQHYVPGTFRNVHFY